MYNQRYHRTLKEGSRRKRTRGNSRIGKGGGYSNTRRDIQDTTSRNRTTNWISGGGDYNCKAKGRYKTIGFYVDWDYNIVVGETNV